MRKRIQLLCVFFLGLCLFLFSGVLAFYNRKEVPESVKDEREELRILTDYQEKSCQEALEDLAELYMSQHTDIRVVVDCVSPLDFQKEICLGEDNSSLADLIICENVMTPVMASMEILKDLTDWYTEQRKDTVNRTAYLGTLVNGKTYSMPFTIDPYVIFYNKDFYEKNGLTPAADMETFIGQLTGVRTFGNYNLAFAGKDSTDLASLFLQLVYLYGGTALDLNGTNSRSFFRDLEKLKDARVMPKEMVSWNQQDLMSAFEQGQVVNVLAKLSSLSFLPEDGKTDFGIIELPDGTNQTGLLHGENISVTVGSGEKAMELLDFLTSRESSEAFCMRTEKMSVHERVENCPGEEKGLEQSFFKRQRYESVKKNSYSSWFLIASAIEDQLTEFLCSTGGDGDAAAASMQEVVRNAIMER